MEKLKIKEKRKRIRVVNTKITKQSNGVNTRSIKEELTNVRFRLWSCTIISTGKLIWMNHVSSTVRSDTHITFFMK